MPPRHGGEGDGSGVRAEPGTGVQHLQVGEGGHENPLLRETHPQRHRHCPDRSSRQGRFVFIFFIYLKVKKLFNSI